jgi:site-specific recombinase XerD
MNSATFHSLLGRDIQTYLDYKRALGRKFDTEEKALYLLDRYLEGQGITTHDALTFTLIDTFLASRPRTKPRSFNHLLGVVRCFFDWMVTQERLPNSPVKSRSRRCPRQPRPFLFTPDLFQQLLELTAQLPDDARAQHRCVVYTLIFSLMYGLGLRVGEVTRLCCRDLDQQRGLLVIRETKFGKSRLVPFGPRMAEKITFYLRERVTWYGPWVSDAPLFSFREPQTRPLRQETISQVFHKLVPRLGLRLPAGIDPPRLHCLRHSFAVQTLLHWYRTDVDPGRRLLHLATFMGHANPESTAWYLTITDELLDEANRRFERFASGISREVLS